jgi:hypothetical protein
MNYEFQSTLYQTGTEMSRAVAFTWLAPGSLCDRAHALAMLADATDVELADDAIEGLGLDCRREGNAAAAAPPTWLEERGVTRDDIAAGFAWLRETIDKKFPRPAL